MIISQPPEVLVAGSNITLSTSGNTITINGASGGVGANFTLNASTGSLSLVAGANITFSSNLSTITISGGAGAAGVAALGTAGATSTGTILLAAGANITLNTGASSITIVGPTVPVATNFSLNASSSSVSLSAGAGIGIGQANSTITISASVQTISQSLTALGNTTSSSAGTFSGLLNISGAGIASVGVGNGSVTISVPAPAASAAVVSSLNGSTGALSISAGAGIGIGQANSTITISASASTVQSQVSLTGNTAGVMAIISSGTLTLAGGTNITLSQAGNAVTISAATAAAVGTINYSAGNNISLSSTTAVNATTLTISALGMSDLTLTMPYPMANIDGTVASKAGTVTGTAGFGSSLFLQRMVIPVAMTITEADLAMAISFAATNNGAGTKSQTFVIYSFGNSTSLASVASVSGTSAWSSGTSTTAGATSLSQFQGGWSGSLIHPFTFASSALPAGEYVFGHLLDFAQAAAASTWTLSMFGDAGALFVTSATAFSAAPSAASAMSSGGLLAGSFHTASSSSSLTAFSAAPSAVNVLSSSALASFGSALRMFSVTNSTTGITMGATASAGALSGLSAISTGTFTSVAGSYHTASGSGAVISNAGTSAFAGFLGSGGLLAASAHTASGSLNVISNVGTAAMTLASAGAMAFGFVGTASASTNPNNFVAGIMSTGAPPVSINLATVAALTWSGSAILAQPWFQLAGS
jgi:hypothetical protein